MGNYAKAEYIAFIAVGFVVDRVSKKNLGGCVAQSSTFAVVICLYLAASHECQSEIDYFGLQSSRGQNYVLRF